MWAPDEAISLNAWANTVGLIATVRFHLCDTQPLACADGGPNPAIHPLIRPYYPRYLYPSLKWFTCFSMHQPLSLPFLRRAHYLVFLHLGTSFRRTAHPTGLSSTPFRRSKIYTSMSESMNLICTSNSEWTRHIRHFQRSWWAHTPYKTKHHWA